MTLPLFRSFVVRAALGIQIVVGIMLTTACFSKAQAQYGVYGSETLIGSGLDCVQGVAVDNSGNVYIINGWENCVTGGTPNTLYKETLQSNGTYVQSIIPTTVTGAFGMVSVAVDSHGNVFVSDETNDRVIEESPNGTGYTESTLLATQHLGPNGVIEPDGIAVDSHDNVYITDYNNWQVLKETFNGTSYTQSVIIPVGYGNPTGIADPTGLAIDSAGNLYLCDGRFNLSEWIYSGGTNGTYTKSTTFPYFSSFGSTVSVDTAGNMYSPSTKYTLYNGAYLQSPVTPTGGDAEAVDNMGNIYVGESLGFSSVVKISTPAISAGSVNLGSTGTVTVPFTITSVGGTAGVAVAMLTQGSPGALDFTDAGTGTCDTNGLTHIYEAGDTCTVVVTFTPQATGLRNGAAQLIRTGGYSQGVVFAQAAVSGTGAGPLVGFGYASPVTVATTGVSSPAGLAVDGAGDVFISNSGVSGNNILKETLTASVYTGSSVLSSAYAKNLSGPTGLAFDNEGDFYVADTGNNRILVGLLAVGTYTESLNNAPIGVGLKAPTGVAVDPLGVNIFVADTGNNRIVQETLIGSSAGGYNYAQTAIASITGLSNPAGISIDSAGNLYIADSGNNRVLKETLQPYVPIANLGAPTDPPYSGVYVQSVVASTGLSSPQDAFVDGQGNVWIADTGNNRILKESLVAGAYVQSVIPIVGTTLSAPTGVSVDGSHTIYISDTGNNRVIKIGISTTAPTANFASTALNATSSDSPQTLVVTNIGSTPLTISVPTAGLNPSLSSTTNFSLNTTGGTACPSISSTSAAGTLAPNATCTLTFSFTPTVAASDMATLTITDNNNNATAATQVINLAGTGTMASAPAVTLNPTSIAFGNETVATPTTATTVTLTNSGTATLNISNVALTGTGLADFAIVNNLCASASLAINASCTLGVTFTPATATSYIAAVSFTDNATGSPQAVSLSGTGIAAAPAVSLTPSVAFGNQGEGTTSGLKSLTLSNTGNAMLNITSITIGGTNPTNFAIDPSTTCGTTLAQSSSCTIYVSFTPTTNIGYSATVSVVDNATGTPHIASLSGTGTYVTPTVTLTPNPVPFGSIVQGNTSTPQTVTLTNTGTSPYNITSYGVSDTTDYAVTTTCGSVVLPTKTCTFNVTFKPLSVATLNTTLNVNDTTDSVNVSTSLTGAGASPAAPVASITTPVAFGNQTVNTSATQTLTLSNTGNATLTNIAVTIGGTNPTFFTQTGGTCGASLVATSTCTIIVTFLPTAATGYSATLSVADNATGSPQVSVLSGTGIVATDFGVTAPTPVGTVPNGSVAQFTIDVAALSGSYTNPVVMSVTGLPAGATATFTPATVTPGSAGATTVLAIQTPSLLAHNNYGSQTKWFALLLLPLIGVRRFRRKLAAMPLSLRALLLCALGLGMLLPLVGCGGGFFGPTAHTSTLTVTGTSGSVQHSTTITLTVQ